MMEVTDLFRSFLIDQEVLVELLITFFRHFMFLAEVVYTPVDMEALKDDLTGLLSALKVHLEESKEDLINREIQAAINFSDWRYEDKLEQSGLSSWIAFLESWNLGN